MQNWQTGNWGSGVTPAGFIGSSGQLDPMQDPFMASLNPGGNALENFQTGQKIGKLVGSMFAGNGAQDANVMSAQSMTADRMASTGMGEEAGAAAGGEAAAGGMSY